VVGTEGNVDTDRLRVRWRRAGPSW